MPKPQRATPRSARRRRRHNPISVLGRTRRRRGTQPVEQVLDGEENIPVIDMDEVPDEPSCIDLTEEQENEGGNLVQDVVDLTNVSVIDSPVVVLGSQSESPPPRRHHRSNTSGRSRISLSSDEDEDLPEIIMPPSTYKSTPKPSTSSGDASSASSPQGKRIVCPVCLDSDGTIRASGRQLKSTYCGHVFCSDCIKQAINAQKKCPSCRKKLSSRQVISLYI